MVAVQGAWAACRDKVPVPVGGAATAPASVGLSLTCDGAPAPLGAPTDGAAPTRLDQLVPPSCPAPAWREVIGRSADGRSLRVPVGDPSYADHVVALQGAGAGWTLGAWHLPNARPLGGAARLALTEVTTIEIRTTAAATDPAAAAPAAGATFAVEVAGRPPVIVDETLLAQVPRIGAEPGDDDDDGDDDGGAAAGSAGARAAGSPAAARHGQRRGWSLDAVLRAAGAPLVDVAVTLELAVGPPVVLATAELAPGGVIVRRNRRGEWRLVRTTQPSTKLRDLLRVVVTPAS
jgi:hypothetical protein